MNSATIMLLVGPLPVMRWRDRVAERRNLHVMLVFPRFVTCVNCSEPRRRKECCGSDEQFVEANLWMEFVKFLSRLMGVVFRMTHITLLLTEIINHDLSCSS